MSVEQARSRRRLVVVAVAASCAYVVVTMLSAAHVTFYWDDYYLLLALHDRGLGGALATGLNGNWWPLATLGLAAQLAAFGSWYPGYLAVNAVLVVAVAWAGWFAFGPLTRSRPWLLVAALVLYACSLGVVVNVTVMTMSWILAPALALTSAALLVRHRPIWAWGGVLALAFLAQSGLFAVLACLVAATLVVARAAERGWRRPGAPTWALAGALVVVGLAGTAVGYVIAGRDPIDYYAPTVSTAAPAAVDTMALPVGEILRSVAAFVPAWAATPLLPPMLVRPAAVPWLVILVDTYLPAVVVVAAGIAAVLVVRWRRRTRSPSGDQVLARLAAAGVLLVPVTLTAGILAAVRTGSGLAPRYWILWLLPAAVAWAMVGQVLGAHRVVRLGQHAVAALLVASALVTAVALPWTFRTAYDIDLLRRENSADQIAQMRNCREGRAAVANQQVSPGLRDDLLCRFVDVVDRRR